MNLKIRPITVDDVRAITRWQYEPPYDIYNMRNENDDEAETLAYFLNPTYAFQAIVDQATAELVGFCSFGLDGQVPGGDYREEAVDIGMGVRPDLTGKGLGSFFVTAVVNYAIQMYRPARLRVTIASFNKRAIRVWEKNGFRPTSSFQHGKSAISFTIFTRKVR